MIIMQLKNILFLLTFALFFAIGQSKFIPLNVDYAVFNGNEDKEFVEVYLSIPQKSLVYEMKDSSWVANFSASLQISKNDSIVFENVQPFLNSISSLDKVNNFSELRHVFSTHLLPGEYTCTVRVMDENASINGEFELNLNVTTHENDVFGISDIQLAAKISQTETESYFKKGSISVVPNPSGVYHVGLPMLYYYAEINELEFDEKMPGEYLVQTEILDLQGNLIRELPENKRVKPGKTAVVIGGGNIITLPSASHLLRLSVTDLESGKKVQRSKRFTLFKPSNEQMTRVQSVTTQLMQSYYEKFSEDVLDDEFDKTRYIATSEEKKVFKGLKGVQAKAEFLVEFWRKRDTDITTPQNEYKIEYFEQVDIATQLFKTAFKAGWKTERGRVYLTYGKPDEIERSTVESSTRPFEVWTYPSLDEGSLFIFADIQGFGDYTLVHSTYRKELYQPDWQSRIQIMLNNYDSQSFPTGINN